MRSPHMATKSLTSHRLLPFVFLGFLDSHHALINCNSHGASGRRRGYRSLLSLTTEAGALAGLPPLFQCACLPAEWLQSCPTLCDPVDCSPPGSSVHEIPQARILEGLAMPSSRGSSRPRMEPASLMFPALAGKFFTTSATWEAHCNDRV